MPATRRGSSSIRQPPTRPRPGRPDAVVAEADDVGAALTGRAGQQGQRRDEVSGRVLLPLRAIREHSPPLSAVPRTRVLDPAGVAATCGWGLAADWTALGHGQAPRIGGSAGPTAEPTTS